MAEETPAESTDLIPQPHGGALRRGGTNKGGTGRPPSEIRRAALKSLDKRLQVLDKIADNEKSRDADRIAAIKALASIGFGATMAMAEVRQKLEATVALIESTLPERQAMQLMLEVRRVWLGR